VVRNPETQERGFYSVTGPRTDHHIFACICKVWSARGYMFVSFSRSRNESNHRDWRCLLGSLIRLELLHLINFCQIIKMAHVFVISTPLMIMCTPNTTAPLLRPPVQIRPPKPSRIPHTYAVRRAVKQQSQAAASTNAQI
jgi:hypothetical protein